MPWADEPTVTTSFVFEVVSISKANVESVSTFKLPRTKLSFAVEFAILTVVFVNSTFTLDLLSSLILKIFWFNSLESTYKLPDSALIKLLSSSALFI